jgi:hypothetical protein
MPESTIKGLESQSKPESIKQTIQKLTTDIAKVTTDYRHKGLEAMLADPLDKDKVKFLFETGRLKSSDMKIAATQLELLFAEDLVEFEDFDDTTNSYGQAESDLGNERSDDTDFADYMEFANSQKGFDFGGPGGNEEDLDGEEFTDFEDDFMFEPSKAVAFDNMLTGFFDAVDSGENINTDGQLFDAAVTKSKHYLTQALIESIQLLGSDVDYTQLSETITNRIQAMPLPEYMMFKQLGNHSYQNESEKFVFKSGLSDNMLDYLQIDKQSFVFDLHKSGSDLKIIKNAQTGNVTFINEILISSYGIWQQANQLVPVSQIARLREGSLPDHTQVISRYSGISHAQLFNIEDGGLANSVQYQSLIREVKSQEESIKATLKSNLIEHGHPHIGNFTIEFLPKNLYEPDTTSQQALSNANSLETDQIKRIEFNPAVYLNNPGDYFVCVRLIDWDQARKLVKPN